MAYSDAWMQDVRFEFYEIAECDLKDIKNLGILYINESNIDKALTEYEDFTKLSTHRISILYAIKSDIVWMNCYSNTSWNISFRGSFSEFKAEVDEYYPNIYSQFFCDEFSGNWIAKGCKYLEGWKKYNTGEPD